MENNHRKSWKGSAALKDNVLSQMEIHYEKAMLECVEIDSVLVKIYGWNNPIDYPFCAKMLGLDEGVLRLGFYLWEGFPEDKKGIKTLIKLRMELLESVPVGVDLTNVCNEFIVWRLEDADFGIINSQMNQSVKVLLQEIIDVFYQDIPNMQVVQPKIELALQEVNNNIRNLWQKEQKTEPDNYRMLNALETAAAACSALMNAGSAADVAETYLFGGNGTNVRNQEQEEDKMNDKLLQLIQAAPEI